MTEQCLKCGGPVEHPIIGASDDQYKTVYPRALPDTLEGIEEEVRAHAANVTFAYKDQTKRRAYRKVLTRLFQGCAECGRRPLDNNLRALCLHEPRKSRQRPPRRQRAGRERGGKVNWLRDDGFSIARFFGIACGAAKGDFLCVVGKWHPGTHMSVDFNGQIIEWVP